MTGHIVSMRKPTHAARHITGLILSMLALGAAVTLCAIPSAHSFELTCAGQRSKPDRPDKDGAPIEISGFFTCAPLTSSQSLDIIVASWTDALAWQETQYYFYAYNHEHDHDRSKPRYSLILFPSSLGEGAWEAADNPGLSEHSTSEYISSRNNNDCMVDDFFVFAGPTASSKTVLIAVHNDDRDLPAEGLPAGPTRLRAFILENNHGHYAFGDEVAAKVLGSYSCDLEDVLPEAKALRAEVLGSRKSLPKE